LPHSDYWDKKLRCGHARVRVFQPALGGVAYTCKDLAESLAGKDRYEFEKFFGPASALTLSKSVFRFIDTRQMISVRGDGAPSTTGLWHPRAAETSRVPCLPRERQAWVA